MNSHLFVSVLLLLLMSCSSSKVLIIAHRGASGYLPEHTLPGVALAHGFDVDYIEPDLVISKDDELIVLHDIHLETTTNVAQVFPQRKRQDGRYYAIDFTLEELKKLDVYERVESEGKPKYPSRFPHKSSVFKIPTFSEYIELVQGLNKSRAKEIGLYPELKAPAFHSLEGKDIVKLFVEVVKEYNLLEMNLFVQCFEPLPLLRLRKMYGDKVKLIQLVGDNDWKMNPIDYEKMLSQSELEKVRSYADGLGLWIGHLLRDENLVEQAKSLGLKVHVYTYRKDETPKDFANEKEFLDYLISKQKVDGIFSDFPDLLRD